MALQSFKGSPEDKVDFQILCKNAGMDEGICSKWMGVIKRSREYSNQIKDKVLDLLDVNLQNFEASRSPLWMILNMEEIPGIRCLIEKLRFTMVEILQEFKLKEKYEILNTKPFWLPLNPTPIFMVHEVEISPHLWICFRSENEGVIMVGREERITCYCELCQTRMGKSAIVMKQYRNFNGEEKHEIIHSFPNRKGFKELDSNSSSRSVSSDDEHSTDKSFIVSDSDDIRDDEDFLPSENEETEDDEDM